MLPCLILLEWVSFANEMMLILSLDYSQIHNQPTTSLILVHGEENANKACWVDLLASLFSPSNWATRFTISRFSKDMDREDLVSILEKQEKSKSVIISTPQSFNLLDQSRKKSELWVRP